MAFNPSPKVDKARQLAKEYNKKKVIILMLDDDTMEYVSYGINGRQCDAAKKLADVAYAAIYNYLMDENEETTGRK